MHIQTHLMSGWCVANLLQLSPRERLFAMIAASAPDLDGLGLLVSRDYYEEFHHVVGHNLLFGMCLAVSLTAFATHRLKAGLLFLVLFHLHLIMDYYGSGPGWSIHYLWPFADSQFESPHAWPLTSWQNFLAGTLFLGWLIAIVVYKGRTPLEVLAPSLDRQIVQRYAKNPGRVRSP